MGLSVQRNLRVVSLPATWFQIDAANLRGHLDVTMPDIDRLDYSFIRAFPGIRLKSRRRTQSCVVEKANRITLDPGNFPAFMRYGFRSSLKADYCVHNLGFRCAKDL